MADAEADPVAEKDDRPAAVNTASTINPWEVLNDVVAKPEASSTPAEVAEPTRLADERPGATS